MEELKLPEKSLHAALSPDGQTLAFVKFDRRGTIMIWNLEEKTVIRELSGHGDGGGDRVLVKAVSKMTSAVVRVPLTIE